jgi:hypothetical protein
MNTHPSGWRCTANHLMTLLTTFSLSLAALGMSGPTTAQTGLTDDPAADYQIWRDDEIFLPFPGTGQLQSTSYEYNPVDETLSNPLPYCQSTATSGSQIAAAAGRIMSPYSDQVVVVYPGAGNNLEVRFADACNLAKPTVSTGPSALLGASSGMPALATPLDAGFPWWYDVATGDLDKYPDADLNYRDEVVVAYMTPGSDTASDPGSYLQPVVAVIDYRANATAPTVTTMKVVDAMYKYSFGIWAGRSVPIIPLSVVTGDFDDDNHQEIAVAYMRDWRNFGVAVFRYTTTETDGVVSHSLSQGPFAAFPTINPSEPQPSRWGFQGTIDAAAGDFDGDGRDELAVAAVEYGTYDPPRIAVDLRTLEAQEAGDTSLTMTLVSSLIPYQDESNGDDFVAGVQLVAGLFKYAPSNDPTVDSFNINRRQLALATNGSSGAVDLRTLVYDANLTPTLPAASEGYAPYRRIPASGSPPGRLNFWLAAGGFNGLRSGDSAADMVWSLAFTTWADNGQVLYLFDPNPSTGALGTAPFTKTLSTIANTSKSTSVAPVVAYDYGMPPTGIQTPGVLYGDSQYLGAPVYFRIEGIPMVDYILQEPPKHVYWKITQPDGDCKQQYAVCNVSAQDAFTLGKTDTTTIGMTSDYHDTYDNSWGVSETATIGFAYKPMPLLPPKVEGSFTESFGYDFAEHHDDYNRNQTQRTLTLQHAATRDDAIGYRVQSIDVWRYPVFGVAVQDPDGNEMPNAFLDITAPTPNDDMSLTGGIDALDWYQPVHENNNILSYPKPAYGTTPEEDFYEPADMGSFQIPCTDTTGKTCDHDAQGHPLSSKTIEGPLLKNPKRLTWSGTAPTVTLTDTWSETEGTTHSWSRTLKNSEEVKMTGRIKLAFVPGLSVNVNAAVAFNGKWSWGGAHTMEMTSNDVNTITLSVPPGVPSRAYRFFPSFYVTDDGTTKVGFAVDTNTAGGQIFWDGEYCGQPDPALNLPLRFDGWTEAGVTKWTPNTLDSRKLMRGFFVRHDEADPDTGDYPEYDGAPTVGDLVRLEARVYNYSLCQTVDPPDGMKVRFDFVPLDSSTHVPDFTKRTTITEARVDNPYAVFGSPYTTIDPIGPREMTTAVINWDTSKLDLNGEFEKNYRIYVVLDPDDAVKNEKYETESTATRTYAPDGINCLGATKPAACMDPGQNNEGFREVKVAAIEAAGPHLVEPADVHLARDALAARDPSHPRIWRIKIVQVEEGQPLQLRVRVDTDMPGGHYAHLQLYDGNPEKGGRMLADKLAFTGNPDGSYVWIEWTPTKLGLHRLYAKVLESAMDTNIGNAIDDLMVMVHRPKRKVISPFELLQWLRAKNDCLLKNCQGTW